MASHGEDSNGKEYVDIHPKVLVKCKTNTNKDYVKDKVYEAIATKRVEACAYTGFRVMKNGKQGMLLTLDRLMDTFMITE